MSKIIEEANQSNKKIKQQNGLFQKVKDAFGRFWDALGEDNTFENPLNADNKTNRVLNASLNGQIAYLENSFKVSKYNGDGQSFVPQASIDENKAIATAEKVAKQKNIENTDKEIAK